MTCREPAMICRIAYMGAVLVLCAAINPVVAQETEESVNLRVREIVKAGQGVLLPLGDVFGTGRDASEGAEDEIGSNQATEPASATDDDALTGADQPAEPAEQTESSDDVAVPEVAEAMEEVEAADATNDIAVPEVAETVEEVEAADATNDVAVPEVAETVAEVEAADATNDVAIPEFAEAVEEVGAAAATDEAATQWPPPADEVEVPEFEQPAAVENSIADDLEPEIVEPAAELGSGEPDTLDAGLVPLRTAELGNPESIGPYRLWLASYKTVRQAKEGWQDLVLAHQDLLADLTPIIVLKDLGAEEGTFFRLQVGPLQTQASAVERCESLQERSLYCSVLGP